MSEPKTYRGQCHCGAVQYEVTTALEGLGTCNCSRCQRLGWVMTFVPAADFRLLQGEASLTPYRFNTHRIEHLFCTQCGIESFARGSDGEGKPSVVVNVNCFEPMPELDRAAIKHWDGRSW